MANYRFEGIYPMLYAFFDHSGELDRDAMKRQVDACIAAGSHGLAIGGLATECNKLSTVEKRGLSEWMLADRRIVDFRPQACSGPTSHVELLHIC